MQFGLNVSSNTEIKELFNKAKGKTLSEADVQKFESIFSSANISTDSQIFSDKAQKHTLENNVTDSNSVEKHTLENKFQIDENEIFSYETFEQEVTKALDEALNGTGVELAEKNKTAPKSGTSVSRGSTAASSQSSVSKGSTAASSSSAADNSTTVITRTPDGQVYTRTTNDDGITVKDKDGNVTQINFDEMSKNFPNAKDKEKLKDILNDLPSEILVDLSKEIDEIIPAKEGEYGWFNPANNNLALTLDDHAKFIIAHELGHAVDHTRDVVNGVATNNSSLSQLIQNDSNVKDSFNKEVNKFFEEYEKKYGQEHPWKTTYAEESYPTEFVATFYRQAKLGFEETAPDKSDWAELMLKTMPETAKTVEGLIEENKQKSPSARKTDTETYYDNGQVKTTSSANNGVAYVDAWNEDGTKAYQEQYYEDGTITTFRDVYDADGNKTTIVETRKPEEYSHGGGGRRR